MTLGDTHEISKSNRIIIEYYCKEISICNKFKLLSEASIESKQCQRLIRLIRNYTKGNLE